MAHDSWIGDFQNLAAGWGGGGGRIWRLCPAGLLQEAKDGRKPQPFTLTLTSFLSGKKLQVLQMCVCVCTRARSVVSDSWQLQAPLSMEFSRQEYWSGLPSPAPGDLPNPGIEPMSPVSPVLAGGFFTTEPPGKPLINCVTKCKFFNLLPPVSSSDVQENSTDHI